MQQNVAPPSVRQIYALAAVLSQLCDEEFPKDREAASELIERFRRQLGHPNPRLEDSSQRRGGSRKTQRSRRFHREPSVEGA